MAILRKKAILRNRGIKLFIAYNVIDTKQTIMKEEELLRLVAGKKQPFKVPEGYFDSLSKRITETLPACEVSLTAGCASRRRRLRLLACAACICGVLCIGPAYYVSRDAGVVADASDSKAQCLNNDDTYIEEVADYAMLDNQDLYSYLSGE